MRPLLADLEQETKAALKTLYGFSELESRRRREAEPWSSTLGGAQPKFLNLIPLMIFSEGETSKATDFLTGRKRKVSGSIIHKTADIMHAQESKEVVGFQLVSTRARGSEHGVAGDGGSREVSPLPSAHGRTGGSSPSRGAWAAGS